MSRYIIFGFVRERSLHSDQHFDGLFAFAGEIVTCRTISPLESPHLSSVRPLAVVAGQPNRLAVRGFNLTRASTRQEIVLGSVLYVVRLSSVNCTV